jgi:hypothetical protein
LIAATESRQGRKMIKKYQTIADKIKVVVSNFEDVVLTKKTGKTL